MSQELEKFTKNYQPKEFIIKEGDNEVQQKLAKQAADLALLSVGLLKGKDLTDFVSRSIEIIE